MRVLHASRETLIFTQGEFIRECLLLIKSESLKKNQDFRLIYRNGRSKANKFIVIYFMKRETGPNRLGISVSKKVGNSVVRHHLTRLVREVYRKHEPEFVDGLDLIVVMRPRAKEIDFFTLERAICSLSADLGLLKA